LDSESQNTSKNTSPKFFPRGFKAAKFLSKICQEITGFLVPLPQCASLRTVSMFDGISAFELPMLLLFPSNPTDNGKGFPKPRKTFKFALIFDKAAVLTNSTL